MKREKPPKVQITKAKELARLYQKLRGQINRLGVSVRAMRSKPLPSKLNNSAKMILETSAQIKKLTGKLPRRTNKP